MNLAFINGEIIDIKEAKVPITCLAFTLGGSVFEAVRVNYNSDKKGYYACNIIKHVDRLFDSLKIMRMKINYSKDDVIKIIERLVIKWNKKTNGYIRITAYIKDNATNGSVYDPNSVSTDLCITIVDKPLNFSKEEGIKCCISSWNRISDNCIPPRVKSACNYENTRLAGHEAIINGYQNSILLNNYGKVSEAAESAIFLIDKNDILVTPSTTSDILNSINRLTIIKIWKKLYSKDVIERVVDRTELYISKEVFICNTAKLIRPVISIDNIDIGNGKVGEITKKIIDTYKETILGNNDIAKDYSILFSEK